MKKLVGILVVVCLSLVNLSAQVPKKPVLSKEEFQSRQAGFITEKAILSKEEANKFFPVFFELQEKKRIINDRVRALFDKGKDPRTTEAQYDELIKGVLNARIESDELEKEYYDQFKKILSPKKIFMVKKAEVRFHRELLKNVNKKKITPKK